MLVLASESPRRRELMKWITEEFIVTSSSADETIPPDVTPDRAVEILAERKACHVLSIYPEATVIGADTVVVLDGKILGKPKTEAEAVKMLRALSGREHFVYTGVAIVNNKKHDCFCECTVVKFRNIDEDEIKAYIKTGSPMDKAGAYGIQDKGGLFVTGIDGDYYNVMGFPICAINQHLKCVL